jgi:hypothetical protein
VTICGFGALVEEELAPPFQAAGFRSMAQDDESHLLISPNRDVLRVTLDPREGVEVDYLVRQDGDRWHSYGLGLFLVKRADRARIPRTRLSGGPMNEGRIRTELRFYRNLIDAVGQDLLATNRTWVAEYPWQIGRAHV